MGLSLIISIPASVFQKEEKRKDIMISIDDGGEARGKERRREEDRREEGGWRQEITRFSQVNCQLIPIETYCCTIIIRLTIY